MQAHTTDETAGRSATLRAFFARYVTERAGCRDTRIEQAFAAVPREPFAGPPPWFIVGSLSFFPSTPRYTQTPDGDPAFLYQDTLLALDPSRGINIGDPSFHAFCLAAFDLLPGEAVLHVGAGSGYYTAILSHLVGPDGRVHAFEIDPELAARAEANLAHRPGVTVQARSGVADPLPVVDAIYVSAAGTHPGWAWLRALKPGGRLLFPLQEARGFGGMLLVEKPLGNSTTWPARFITRATFVMCDGLQDADTGRRLGAAFAVSNTWQGVRSLRFDEGADETCWFRGDGWWLSSRVAETSAGP